jgi:hypothetical protein
VSTRKGAVKRDSPATRRASEAAPAAASGVINCQGATDVCRLRPSTGFLAGPNDRTMPTSLSAGGRRCWAQRVPPSTFLPKRERGTGLHWQETPGTYEHTIMVTLEEVS